MYSTILWFGFNYIALPKTDGVEQDLSGNSLPFSAETNYRVGITKFIDMAAGTWTLRADHSYRDDYLQYYL